MNFSHWPSIPLKWAQWAWGGLVAVLVLQAAYLLWPQQPAVWQVAPHPATLGQAEVIAMPLPAAESADSHAELASVAPVTGERTTMSSGTARTHRSSRKASSHASSKKNKITSGTININTASLTELARLPGVGPKMAERIVAYRKEHGGFSSVDALNDVSGIGPKKLAKMSPFVRIH